MSSVRARTSGLAFAALVGALVASPGMAAGATTSTPTSTSTQSPASGPIDCPDAYPLSKIADGLQGIGWTVAKGSTPERFEANILGVLDDGIAYDTDMILAEVSSASITRAGGIWAGMSGSPVYAPDGRLIGAVAYGLVEGSTMIAGLTPAQEMLPMVGKTVTSASKKSKTKVSPKAVAKLDSQMSARVQSEGVSPQAAAGGLRRLGVPLWLSGSASGKYQQKLVGDLSAKGFDVKTGGSTAASGSVSADGIHAGGNFAAAISTGALTMGGTGTTTAVCNGRAVAFGHPMTGTGPVSMAAMSANVITVIPDIFRPFKASNFGGVVGTLDQDNATGISATLGTAPATSTPVVAVVTGPDGTTRRAESRVYDDGYVADVAANQIYSAVMRALNSDAQGSATVTLAMSGKRADGTAFSVSRSDRVSSLYRGSLAMTIGDLVYGPASLLVGQDLEDVTITKLTATAKISTTPTALRFSSLSMKKGSTWVNLTDESYATVDPGTLTLRTTLSPSRGVTATAETQEFSVDIPESLAGQSVGLSVESGFDPWSIDTSTASSFSEILKMVKGLPSTTAVRLTVTPYSESGNTKPIVMSVPITGTVTPFAVSAWVDVTGGATEEPPAED